MKIMIERDIGDLLIKKACELENGNYHNESEFYRDLASFIDESDKLTIIELLKYILEYDWMK